MFFISIVFKNLIRRSLRTFFTVLGIATAVAAFIALIGLARGYENAWQNTLEERNTHLFASQKGVVDILSGTIEKSVCNEMAKIKGVNRVSGERIELLSLDSGSMIIVAGWPKDSYLWESIHLKEGALPDPSSANEVVLGSMASTALKIRPGGTFKMHGKVFKVSGISDSGSAMKNNAMILTLEGLEEINNTQGEITTVNFRLDHPDNETAVLETTRRLQTAFPEYTFTKSDALSENNKILQMFQTMAWGTSMIAIFICLVVIINTLLMSVMERTHEIGVLVTLGWSARRIIGLIALEGLVLTIAGAIAGSVIGTYGLFTLADMPQMKSFIQPGIDLRLIFEIVCATLAIGLIGSSYPAWIAIRLKPAEALRHG